MTSEGGRGGGAIEWGRIAALTFDCYGTLVDWETGLAADVRRGLDAGRELTDEALLAAYARAEAAAEAVPFRLYKEVLRVSLKAAAAELGRGVADPDAIVNGIARWPLFADTRAALARLGARFRLCVV